MKLRWILVPTIALFLGSCKGQTQESKTTTGMSNDTLKAVTPKENVVVNKEYDKNGNLIRYDSSYTYFYSNIANDSLMEDSIFKQFRQLFNQEYPFSREAFFDRWFFEDSLLRYDFYKDDFFTERFRRNMQEAERLFRQMDSLKNSFYLQRYPAPKSDTR